jgi:cysteine desulfurase
MPAGRQPEVLAYLDHATTSPLRPEVVETLIELLGVLQADPGRPYAPALRTRELIEDARDSVAGLVGATPRQVVFTSSIAESITTAVAGLADGGTVLVPGTERSSTAAAAARHGQLEGLAVTATGTVDVDALRSRLATGGVTLVTCSIANHETGVLDDVAAIVAAAREAGAAVHVDASTAVGHLPVDLGTLDPDAATFAAELLGGPVGAAALVVRRGRPFRPLIVGASQERGRRAGLENQLGIVGFGVAATLLDAATIAAEAMVADGQRARLEAAATRIAGVEVVGASTPRAPHVACMTVEGVEAEPVLLGLDRAGVAVHSGSACAAESLEPSPVLAAMGLDAARSLRASVGWSTVDGDIDHFATNFGPVVEALRALRA